MRPSLRDASVWAIDLSVVVRLGVVSADEAELGLDPDHNMSDTESDSTTERKRKAACERSRAWRRNNKERFKQQVKKWKDKHPGYDTKRQKMWRRNNPLKYAMLNYPRAARRRGIEWNLKRHHVDKLINGDCTYCGSKPSATKNGIDRVDNKAGYTKSNCKSCCKICNIMKHTLDVETFLKQVMKIAFHIYIPAFTVLLVSDAAVRFVNRGTVKLGIVPGANGRLPALSAAEPIRHLRQDAIRDAGVSVLALTKSFVYSKVSSSRWYVRARTEMILATIHDRNNVARR
jgi:hypothetical protein